MADANRPFWFHQGYDLGTFNLLDQSTKMGMQVIIDHHQNAWKLHKRPTTLDDWSRHLRMSVLVYEAYFQAFYEPFEQYVGGGADVVWAAWPPAPPPD